jgi:hypothetical protein
MISSGRACSEAIRGAGERISRNLDFDFERDGLCVRPFSISKNTNFLTGISQILRRNTDL